MKIQQAAQVALRRQQQNVQMNPSTTAQLNSKEYIEKIQNMESLLAQKRAYQKQLKSLQQSTYNKSLMNRGKLKFVIFNSKSERLLSLGRSF